MCRQFDSAPHHFFCSFHKIGYSINFSKKVPTYIWIAITIAIANFLFKFLFLTDYSIWYDESISIYQAQKSLDGIKAFSSWAITPPFYLYTLHFWIKLFGISAASARSMSILFNALAAGLLYILAIRHFNKKTALLASIFFFTSDPLFYYAQEARTYSMSIFFALFSSLVYFELVNKTKWYWIVLLGIVNWAAIYSHYLFALIPLFQIVTQLVYRKWKKTGFLALSGLLTLLCFNNYINRMIEVIQRGGNQAIKYKASFQNLYENFSNLTNGHVMLVVYIIVICWGCVFIWKRNKLNIPKHSLTYLALWGLGYVLLLFALGQHLKVFIPRYLLFAAPGLFLLIASLFSLIQLHKKVRVAVLVILFIFGLTQIDYTVAKPMNYKKGVAFIKEKKDQNTLVLLQSSSIQELFAYYYDRKVFIQHKALAVQLYKENVISLSDTSSFNMINLNAYNKILYLKTFKNIKKKKLVFKYLTKKGFKIDKRITFKWAGIIKLANNTTFNDTLRTLKERYNENPDLVINHYKIMIRNNPEWMQQVHKKAKKRGIPVDSMLYLDAKWYLNQ